MRNARKMSTMVIIVLAVVDAVLITVLVLRHMAQPLDGATSPTAPDRVEVSTKAAWHVLADDEATKLHAPDGKTPVPCAPDAPVTDLTGVTRSVGYVLCADGSLHRTTDAGTEWHQVNAPDKTQAVAFPWPDRGYVAVRGQAGCNGVAVLDTTDSGRTWARTGCVSDVPANKALALSFAEEGAGVLLADTSSWWSDDEGQTWEPAS